MELGPQTLERKHWPALAAIPTAVRLRVLYDLCVFQHYNTEHFWATSMSKDLGVNLRAEPVGADKHGVKYWFIADCLLFIEGGGERWECLCWDAASWAHFLETTTLGQSRRASEKRLITHIKNILHPTAIPYLEEDRRRRNAKMKKQNLELQRTLFLDTRKRSSRLLAKEFIKQDLLEESPPASPRRSEPPLQRGSGFLSREERNALRDKRLRKLEEKKIIEALELSMATEGKHNHQQENEENLDIEPDSVDVEEQDEEEEPKGLNRSPIKLVVKMGPNGTLRSELFIGEEIVERKDSIYSGITHDPHPITSPNPAASKPPTCTSYPKHHHNLHHTQNSTLNSDSQSYLYMNPSSTPTPAQSTTVHLHGLNDISDSPILENNMQLVEDSIAALLTTMANSSA